MQPEVSTDVWSYPYINQEKTILELSKSLKKIDYFLDLYKDNSKHPNSVAICREIIFSFSKILRYYLC